MASADEALKVTSAGIGIRGDGETRRPELDGAGASDVEVALGVWVATGLPAVEPQALAVRVTSATVLRNGASFGELTPSLPTAEREFGFCQLGGFAPTGGASVVKRLSTCGTPSGD
jgi:hypothetical protein